jgi:rare lipoprotein A
MCVAFALAGFIASNDSASAARHSANHRAPAHRFAASGHRHGERHSAHVAHPSERHAGRHSGRRARLAGYHHHRGRMVRLAPRESTASLLDATPASGGQVGNASFYSGGSHHTASGGLVGAATCAHRTLPFGTKVLVTNLRSGAQAVLTVNDRGPFVRGRIVDVSRGAAGTLGMVGAGTAPVRVQVLASRKVEGSIW